MDSYIDFHVELGTWKAKVQTPVKEDIDSPTLLTHLASTLKGTDAAIESYLGKVLALTEVNALLQEALGEGDADKAFALLTSRKFGQAINAATEKEGWQAKEKKEMQQFLRAYCTRKLVEKKGFTLNYGGTFPLMDVKGGFIQFIANYPGWKCIKKYKITEKTDPRTFLEFMSSYKVSLENRLEKYLHSISGEAKLKEFVSRAPGKTEKVSAVFSYVHTLAPSDAALKTLIQTLVLRKTLRARGLFVEASQIEVPGLKRLLKKKN